MKKLITMTLIILLFTLPFIIANQNKSYIVSEDKVSILRSDKKKVSLRNIINSIRSTKPKIAIILDDAGDDLPYLDYLFLLPRTITISVLPFKQNAKLFANEMLNKGFPVIAHIPMEPQDRSQMHIPDLFLLRSDNDVLIKIKMELYLQQNLPFVEGCNNHMGSSFTSDPEAMQRFANILKEKKLFFIDSYTISSSKAYEVCKNNGIPSFKNNIFLDHHEDIEYIRNQFKKTIELTKMNKKVCAIGHITSSNTLIVLMQEIPKYSREVDFVKIADLVK